MSAFGEAISEVLLNLGIPTAIERLPREQIINRTLVAGGSFDLYLLDWRFPLYPAYLCDLFGSQNDTLLTGGYNTTGYNSPRFDETCESFLTERDGKLAQDQAFRLQSQLAYDRPYLPLYHPKIIDLSTTKVMLPYQPSLDGFTGAAGFQTDIQVWLEP
jgi:ABC-type transport system substrate-binding protein